MRMDFLNTMTKDERGDLEEKLDDFLIDYENEFADYTLKNGNMDREYFMDCYEGLYNLIKEFENRCCQKQNENGWYP
nr:MAG TPA: hypothetical protein [Inoviridae sp.]